MPTDDRDRQLERALARHLGKASPDAACPDAEILAAYHERTLSLEEMAKWKGHVAGCSRCQEALALVEQSDAVVEGDWVEEETVTQELAGMRRLRSIPAGVGKEMVHGALPALEEAAVPAPAKLGSRLNWRWVVPVGALAAAVIVWIGVRDIETANKAAQQNVQVAQNREASEPPTAHSYPATAPAAPEDALKRKDSSVPKSEVAENRADRVEPSPPRPSGHTGDTAAIIPGVRQLPPPAGESSERRLPKPEAAQLAGTAETETKKSRAAPLDLAPSPPAAKPGVTGAPANEPTTPLKLPQAMSQSVAVTAAPPTLNPSSSDLQMTVRDSQELMRMAAEDHRLIVAPGQKHVWRVGDGGSILRSTDGGKTWKKQKSGVTNDLTSGSATSDKVAWVAGKNGTLLLTTDGGKHWKGIPTPIDGDLGGVHAADATHASIWDVANRKGFETSDGGATWKPSGNE